MSDGLSRVIDGRRRNAVRVSPSATLDRKRNVTGVVRALEGEVVMRVGLKIRHVHGLRLGRRGERRVGSSTPWACGGVTES